MLLHIWVYSGWIFIYSSSLLARRRKNCWAYSAVFFSTIQTFLSCLIWLFQSFSSISLNKINFLLKAIVFANFTLMFSSRFCTFVQSDSYISSDSCSNEQFSNNFFFRSTSNSRAHTHTNNDRQCCGKRSKNQTKRNYTLYTERRNKETKQLLNRKWEKEEEKTYWSAKWTRLPTRHSW